MQASCVWTLARPGARGTRTSPPCSMRLSTSATRLRCQSSITWLAGWKAGGTLTRSGTWRWASPMTTQASHGPAPTRAKQPLRHVVACGSSRRRRTSASSTSVGPSSTPGGTRTWIRRPPTTRRRSAGGTGTPGGWLPLPCGSGAWRSTSSLQRLPTGQRRSAALSRLRCAGSPTTLQRTAARPKPGTRGPCAAAVAAAGSLRRRAAGCWAGRAGGSAPTASLGTSSAMRSRSPCAAGPAAGRAPADGSGPEGGLGGAAPVLTCAKGLAERAWP
mmetsp:Transcript_138356/g.385923  ORF Transcript_138356/g.385923 Transcript_138356/m.385923 type:complete len:274 (+) Transcript_138356:1641-2462(+)